MCQFIDSSQMMVKSYSHQKGFFCSLLVRQYQLSLWRESEQFWFVMDTTCNLNQKMSTSQVINEVKVVLKTVIPFKLIVLLQ